MKETLSAPGEENIGLVLTPDPRAHTTADYSQNYAATRAALANNTPLTYYARPRYLFQRLQRLVAQAANAHGLPERRLVFMAAPDRIDGQAGAVRFRVGPARPRLNPSRQPGKHALSSPILY